MSTVEATGDYWKPFYYGLEGRVNLMLVNARHAKNLPERKLMCRMHNGWLNLELMV